MSIEIKVPILPESVQEATIIHWHKAVGDSIAVDENLVDIETDKVVLEVPSPVDGILKKIIVESDTVVEEQQVIGLIEKGATKTEPARPEVTEKPETTDKPASQEPEIPPSGAGPAARKLLSEHDIDASEISGSGKHGRLLKEDVLRHISQTDVKMPVVSNDRSTRREPMSRLRATIAQRLTDAQNTQAMLTTFNDVNLHNVIAIRQQYKTEFEERYQTRLGFMSFFIKATVAALQQFPSVNASIEDQDILYHNYYDIGIATASPRGLVVPIIRNADTLTMANIELAIKEFSQKAQQGKLQLEELSGGTFTISNGGSFGSLLSTPIVNPPQSAILGMHRIEKRAVVEEDAIVIRPMMYLALTYDHRIIDGKESVQFLKTIKGYLEDPARMLLDI